MLHEGQRDILRNGRRFNTVACGRRFGKTTLGVSIAAYGAPGAPGGLLAGYSVGWFAPTYRLLDEAWRASRGFLRSYLERIDTQQKRLELSTGGAMDFWTLEDPDAGRGRKYGIVVVDEAAMARHLQPAWEQAIRPTLTDFAGGAWFFSTPKGRNYFWRLHQLGASRSDWAAHHAPSSANPYLPAAEIEQARSDSPERVFMQEYLAEFLEDGGGVFRGISAAPVCAWLDGKPQDADRTQFTIGVDWGRSEDFTVFTVIRSTADGAQIVHLDRFTGIGYELQTGRLRALWERFGRCAIVAESNSMGGPLIESLQRAGVTVRPFHTSNASKAEAIEGLALGIESGRLALPNDSRIEVLKSELLSFTQERLPSGLIRYCAPPGSHDDCVMSAAIAHVAATAHSGHMISMQVVSL